MPSTKTAVCLLNLIRFSRTHIHFEKSLRGFCSRTHLPLTLPTLYLLKECNRVLILHYIHLFHTSTKSMKALSNPRWYVVFLYIIYTYIYFMLLYLYCIYVIYVIILYIWSYPPACLYAPTLLIDAQGLMSAILSLFTWTAYKCIK